uniref:Putative secreted protein n=1 Tax=Anopheles triannulatus TaxID=58253 RepID=A0A2M4B6N2_9DIPT
MATFVSLWLSFSALLNTFKSSSSESVAPGSFCCSGSITSFSLAGESRKISFRQPFSGASMRSWNFVYSRTHELQL